MPMPVDPKWRICKTRRQTKAVSLFCDQLRILSATSMAILALLCSSPQTTPTATCLMQSHQDAGKVALMLGNSPGILLTHYVDQVGVGNADAFWALAPDAAG